MHTKLFPACVAYPFAYFQHIIFCWLCNIASPVAHIHTLSIVALTMNLSTRFVFCHSCAHHIRALICTTDTIKNRQQFTEYDENDQFTPFTTPS